VRDGKCAYSSALHVKPVSESNSSRLMSYVADGTVCIGVVKQCQMHYRFCV